MGHLVVAAFACAGGGHNTAGCGGTVRRCQPQWLLSENLPRPNRWGMKIALTLLVNSPTTIQQMQSGSCTSSDSIGI